MHGMKHSHGSSNKKHGKGKTEDGEGSKPWDKGTTIESGRCLPPRAFAAESHSAFVLLKAAALFAQQESIQ
jgi:hypothetical protein